jgi:hypothetical protein
MHFSENGEVGLTRPEQDEFEKFRDRLCADTQRELKGQPTLHDIFEIVLPHINGGCADCAKALADYLDRQETRDNT